MDLRAAYKNRLQSRFLRRIVKTNCALANSFLVCIIPAVSVSNESPSNGDRPKRKLVRLSESEWVAARFDYESGNLNSYPSVAAKYGISEETVTKHARKAGWQRNAFAKHGQIASAKLREATDQALTKTAEQIATKLGKQFEHDMAPWFEREKRLHIRDSIRRAKHRQKLLDSVVDQSEDFTPKDAAFIARSDDIYDQIKRRNLGMNDNQAPVTPLTLNVLANHSAIQFVEPNDQS